MSFHLQAIKLHSVPKKSPGGRCYFKKNCQELDISLTNGIIKICSELPKPSKQRSKGNC